jgi:hypothetical protein
LLELAKHPDEIDRAKKILDHAEIAMMNIAQRDGPETSSVSKSGGRDGMRGSDCCDGGLE